MATFVQLVQKNREGHKKSNSLSNHPKKGFKFRGLIGKWKCISGLKKEKMQNFTGLLHTHPPALSQTLRLQWKNFVKVCNRSPSAIPGGFICILFFKCWGSDKEKEMINVELLALSQKGLKEKLNTLLHLSVVLINSAWAQKEGRDFLGTFSGTESSSWGCAVHWYRQHLCSGPEGPVELLCCCFSCPIKHPLPTSWGHQLTVPWF